MSNEFISQICTYTIETNETKFYIDHLFSRVIHLNTVVIKTNLTDHYTIIGSLLKSPNNNKHHIDSRNNNTASYNINYKSLIFI